MGKSSNLVVLAIHLKISDRSCMPSIVKLGECLLKYSSLVSLTRLVSQPNASKWLHVSTLYKGGISHCLELGGPSEVALEAGQRGRALGGMLSTGSAERCCCLGLGECLGTGEEGATGADGCSIVETACDKVNGWDWGAHPINKW